MKIRLIWKLLSINLLVIVCVVVITWWAIDFLAADYFMILMRKYNISPESAHQMFIQSVHRNLIWSTLAALLLAVLLSLLMTRRVLRPLMRMIQLTGKVAAGDYAVRVPVKASDEVARLAQAFNDMAVSLQRVEGLRKKMVLDVAHELRTPLTNMRGYLEGLQDKVVEANPKTFQLLHEESLRLTALVDDLLDLARADAARSDLRLEAVDYTALWQELLGEWSPRFKAKGIRVISNLDPAAAFISADPRKLQQILRNLLQNALRYTKEGGEFQVSTLLKAKEVLTSLENDGSKVAPEDLPHIFERFYRGERSRSRDYGGAGIGLAIVKELVEAHGGQVGAEVKGERVRIFFTLPHS